MKAREIVSLVYYVYQIIFFKEIELVRDVLQEWLHVIKKANKAQDLPSARWRTRKVNAISVQVQKPESRKTYVQRQGR